MHETLETYLDVWAGTEPRRADIARTLRQAALAARQVADLAALGPLAGALGATREGSRAGNVAGGDVQKELDIRAEEFFIDALRSAPLAAIGSEESEAPIPLHAEGRLVLALDPLDGSGNIAINAPIGSIFSILPTLPDAPPAAALLQPGTAQLAAGFFLYSVETVLVLTLGAGTQVFTLDRRQNAFALTRRDLALPEGTHEYAINVSNYRHWEAPVRAYIDDCVAGAEGPRGVDFNMRWLASVVGEAFRILLRGGIYLYPGDARPGYREGRLRLVYEANPLAFLIEQAGGAASDGVQRILTRVPRGLHQRVPLVFGSRDKVARIAAYCAGELAVAEHAPLFGRRGLFRSSGDLAPCR